MYTLARRTSFNPALALLPTISSRRSARQDYLRWLSEIQDERTLNWSNQTDLIKDVASENSLLTLFLYPDNDGRDNPVNIARIAEVSVGREEHVIAQAVHRVRLALRAFRRIDAERAATFHLIATRIFCSNLPGISSGTVNHAVGVIWINPLPSHNLSDLVELLVHELAHTMTYIDEIQRPHFTSDDVAAETEAISVVRRAVRPAYHAWHSLIVALEILDFRRRAQQPSPSVHPLSADMIDACAITIKSFLSLPMSTVFTPHGQELFARAQGILEDLAVYHSPDRHNT